jgi:hypothetical protein
MMTSETETPTPEDIKRFWEKVDIKGPDECWEWMASRVRGKYGRFRWNGKTRRANRFAFFVTNGYWPEVGRHDCDNPGCCNPSHILNGTTLENNRDIVRRGRNNPPSGANHYCAKLTEQDVRAIRAANPQSRSEKEMIAASFGIGLANFSKIRRRDSWKHVW